MAEQSAPLMSQQHLHKTMLCQLSTVAFMEKILVYIYLLPPDFSRFVASNYLWMDGWMDGLSWLMLPASEVGALRQLTNFT